MSRIYVLSSQYYKNYKKYYNIDNFLSHDPLLAKHVQAMFSRRTSGVILGETNQIQKKGFIALV